MLIGSDTPVTLKARRKTESGNGILYDGCKLPKNREGGVDKRDELLEMCGGPLQQFEDSTGRVDRGHVQRSLSGLQSRGQYL